MAAVTFSRKAHRVLRLIRLAVWAPLGNLQWAVSDKKRTSPRVVVALRDEEPIQIFQQFAGGHPSGRDDVREIPSVAAQRRGSPSRARDRYQPRDRPVLVEPVWPNVRRRDPQETSRAHARLSSVALAFGRGVCEGQRQALLSLARRRL